MCLPQIYWPVIWINSYFYVTLTIAFYINVCTCAATEVQLSKKKQNKKGRAKCFPKAFMRFCWGLVFHGTIVTISFVQWIMGQHYKLISQS